MRSDARPDDTVPHDLVATVPPDLRLNLPARLGTWTRRTCTLRSATGLRRPGSTRRIRMMLPLSGPELRSASSAPCSAYRLSPRTTPVTTGTARPSTLRHPPPWPRAHFAVPLPSASSSAPHSISPPWPHAHFAVPLPSASNSAPHSISRVAACCYCLAPAGGCAGVPDWSATV
jgi:hypothetical protein